MARAAAIIRLQPGRKLRKSPPAFLPEEGDSGKIIGVWRSLVARFVRDEEAVGSNPATPTTLKSAEFAPF